MTRRLLTAAAALAASSAVLALAAPAPAAVVVNRGIAGVEIGMEDTQVIALLGHPRAPLKTRIDGATYSFFEYEGDRARVSAVLLRNGTVVSITSSHAGERTATGLGVGSSQAHLRRRLPGVRCRGILPGIVHCEVSNPSTRRRTTFVLLDGRVNEVMVSLRIPRPRG